MTAPPPAANSRVRFGNYTTEIAWSGADCIEVRYPDGGSLPVEVTCAATQSAQMSHSARTGQAIGADPIIGTATELACTVTDDATGEIVASDYGTLGDGHDVNCTVYAP